jgi:DNA-binding transcriptional LysR family regulator
VLRICIFSLVAPGFLRELIRAYGEHYPDVGVEISESGLREYVAFVCKVRVDVALVMGNPVAPNSEVVKAAPGRDGPLRCKRRRANIHDGPEHNTVRQIDENLLRRTAGPYNGSFASNEVDEFRRRTVAATVS